VGALIELGAGFSPLLTGRENVYNNGAVLGFTKEEIDKKFDEIIEFAELNDFIDTPVQNYSSGMKVRLGFAIAAQMEPDILLIDEVLAVGDLGFQAKCFNKINELVGKCAIIFVSHSMPQVARIASQVLHLDKGKVRFLGNNVGEGIEGYYKGFNSEVAQFVGLENSVHIDSFQLFSNNIPIVQNGDINQSNEIKICIKYRVNKFYNIKNHELTIGVYDQSLRSVMAVLTTDKMKNELANVDDEINLEISFQCVLAPGKYSLWFYFAGAQSSNGKNNFSYATYQSYFNFNVIGSSVFSTTPIHLPASWIKI
jgi:lipopolysaccharide transport system ATP-binding protein